jgi:hypothetical protein
MLIQMSMLLQFHEQVGIIPADKNNWNPNFVSRTKTMNALADHIKKKTNGFFIDSITVQQKRRSI